MPLPNQEGKIALTGLIGQLVRSVLDRPILLVRSSKESHSTSRFTAAGGTTTRTNLVKENL
jgi:hypothetical protein